MEAMKVEITEAVRVELRVGARTIVREYAAGLVTAAGDDDRVALEHLLGMGLAKVAARSVKAPAAGRSDE